MTIRPFYDVAVARSLTRHAERLPSGPPSRFAGLERDGVLNGEEEEPRRQRLIDRRELRGWPAAGKGIGGEVHA
jgi:hypothetical protein